MRYRWFRARGLFTGSGVVEAGLEEHRQLSSTPCTPPGSLETRITAGAAVGLHASGNGEAVRSRKAVPGSDGRYHLRSAM